MSNNNYFSGLFFGIKALLPEKEVEETTTTPTQVYTPEPKQDKPELFLLGWCFRLPEKCHCYFLSCTLSPSVCF